MRAQARSVGEQDGAGTGKRRAACLQKGAVVVAGHETDFARFLGQRRRKAKGGERRRIVGFFSVRQWKDRLGQGGSGNKGEKIALVTRGVGPAIKRRPVSGRLKPGVMPRGEPFGPEAARGDKQQAEFHVPVAGGAGIGRKALGVGGDEGGDDPVMKRFREVHGVKRHTEGVALRGNGRGQITLLRVGRQKMGMHTHYLMAGPAQQPERQQAVRPAGQRHSYPHIPPFQGVRGG